MRVDSKGNTLESNTPTEILCSEDVLLVKGSSGLIELYYNEEEALDLSLKDVEDIIAGLQLAISMKWFEKVVKEVK